MSAKERLNAMKYVTRFTGFITVSAGIIRSGGEVFSYHALIPLGIAFFILSIGCQLDEIQGKK